MLIFILNISFGFVAHCCFASEPYIEVVRIVLAVDDRIREFKQYEMK
jgi:hypothetical protein